MRNLTHKEHKEVGKNVSNEKNTPRPAAAVFGSALLTTAVVGIMTTSQPGCGPGKNPVDVNTDTIVVVTDSIVCPPGMGGVRLFPWRPATGSITEGMVLPFGNLPIKFSGVKTGSLGSDSVVVLDLARENGHLLARVEIPKDSSVLVDLGLEKYSIYRDSLSLDSPRWVRLLVTNVVDTGEVYAPKNYINWGDTSKLISDTMKVGATASFGEFTIRVNAIELTTPTKLSVNFSVLRYNGADARKAVVPELVPTSINTGMSTIEVTPVTIHLVISDTTDAASATRAPVAADVTKSWAILSVGKDCTY